MPLSIYELGLRFHSGKKSGQSSRTRIINKPENTLLVDYDWAVLAKRHKDTGHITYYSGWDRYSRSTSRHITRTNLRGSNFISEARPTLDSIDDFITDDSVQTFRNTYDDVFIDPFTKKLKLRRRK